MRRTEPDTKNTKLCYDLKVLEYRIEVIINIFG